MLDRSESAAVEFFRDRIRAAEIWVNHANQPDRLALLRKLVVYAGVVASENADANNCYCGDVRGRQMILLSIETADLESTDQDREISDKAKSLANEGTMRAPA